MATPTEKYRSNFAAQLATYDIPNLVRLYQTVAEAGAESEDAEGRQNAERAMGAIEGVGDYRFPLDFKAALREAGFGGEG